MTNVLRLRAHREDKRSLVVPEGKNDSSLSKVQHGTTEPFSQRKPLTVVSSPSSLNNMALECTPRINVKPIKDPVCYD